jgi:chromate transporter
MQGAVTKPGIAHSRLAEVFFAFLKLGLTSFGGPVAHLGYFHGEFVVRKRWLEEQSYADPCASSYLGLPAARSG